MFMTTEEANRGFVQMVEHAVENFDAEDTVEFYYFIGGAATLMRSIRGEIQKDEEQMKAAEEETNRALEQLAASDVSQKGEEERPRGRYL